MEIKRTFWSRTGLLFVLLAIAFFLVQTIPLLMITDSAMDINIHDDYFVLPGGIYAAPVCICLVLALLYALFTRITKKHLGTRLGILHWLSSGIALFGIYALPVFGLWTVLHSGPARYYSYNESPMFDGVVDMNTIVTVLLAVGVFGQALFLLNVILSSRRGPMLDRS